MANTTNSKTPHAALILDFLSKADDASKSLHDQVVNFVADPTLPGSAKAWEDAAKKLVRMAPNYRGHMFSGSATDSVLRSAARELRHYAKLQLQAA